jgi:plasmid stabilization system protein ParE
MPKQIIWSTLSEKDFVSILDYLQTNWDIKVVQKFIEVVDGIIGQISNNPKQFPMIDKIKKVRKCVLNKHNTLYYRDRYEYIDILRIYDNRQDPKKLKFN